MNTNKNTPKGIDALLYSCNNAPTNLNKKRSMFEFEEDNFDEIITDQKGASTIVEATFIFPFAIAILLFVIMLSDYYYSRSAILADITQTAISTASQVQDPKLANVTYDESGYASYPTDPHVRLNPYRQLTSYIGQLDGDCSLTHDAVVRNKNALDRKINAASLTGLATQSQNSVEYCAGIFSSEVRVKALQTVKIPFLPTFIDPGTQTMKHGSIFRQPIQQSSESTRNLDIGFFYFEYMSVGSDRLTNKLEGFNSQLTTFGSIICIFVSSCTSA
ncbi:MAG: hypothetical protein LBN03_00350 [Bifidobacteriaceae bacterium]|jgi:hypothetical protein|nr:hypothetical protein [Bifidobacteriaceae bacterium]